MTKKLTLRNRLKNNIAAAGQAIGNRVDFGDWIFIAAVGAIGYGVSMIYVPAAWITVGLIGTIVAIRLPGGDK